MLGKSLSATGSSNSMNGTITKMAKGISRNKSVPVRTNYNVTNHQVGRAWLYSRRESLTPASSFHSRRVEMRLSFHSNFVPSQ